MGVDRKTLEPFHCCSDNCEKCIASMRDRYNCDTVEILEWANAEHEDKYEHDEVVLCKNGMFDEWTPSHYAYYKEDGRHRVYANGCSSLTCKGAVIAVKYIRKYDKDLAWKRDEY